MTKKEILHLLAAFLLGVILAIMFSSRSRNARYVPFGSNRTQILDTRNGHVYKTSFGRGGKTIWSTAVHKVGTK